MKFPALLAAHLAGLATLALPPMAPAQSSRAPGKGVGTLIVAHGGGPVWDAQVEAVAREVSLEGPVGVSFLMGPGARARRFQDVVRELEQKGAREIVVVPMLVSSHSGHYEQVRYLVGQRDTLDTLMQHHLHMSGIERPAGSVPLRLAPGMDDAPEIAGVLADRARALAPSPAGRALFLVGHGPNSAEDYAAWMTNLRRVADTVRVRTGFRSVLVDLVRDDAPKDVRAEAVRRVRELITLQNELTGQPVVVVPVMVASGKISREKLPADLAGLPIVYSGDALLPDAGMARWVESRVRATAAAHEEVAGTR
ncbi:MAG TPA: CbiX/SirB N-terminal domain-containing protein [Gemmatimonadales bacterium]|nr:CbiX/SirB N-terminal domain-containing protein [Gemmatimonadales bacterium]